ncbi:MAG: hypothetical protein IKH57_16795 [Clostridia bacterium]|nr:hypothetical protein [Clostridia bacterium]
MPYNLEASIKLKGLTLDNYQSHLDEMTDEEIAFMLGREPDAKRIAEEMQAAGTTPREQAEDKRDFGF